jgi:type II secretory pathway predicted ATPase ExeA
MYLKHFAFTQFPFDHTLESEALFASSTLAEAQVRLKHLLELRGIGLLTGEAGCGKTTVCRRAIALNS